jgi:hypothetical protein
MIEAEHYVIYPIVTTKEVCMEECQNFEYCVGIEYHFPVPSSVPDGPSSGPDGPSSGPDGPSSGPDPPGNCMLGIDFLGRIRFLPLTMPTSGRRQLEVMGPTEVRLDVCHGHGHCHGMFIAAVLCGYRDTDIDNLTQSTPKVHRKQEDKSLHDKTLVLLAAYVVFFPLFTYTFPPS